MGVIGKIEDKWDQTRQIKIKQDPQRLMGNMQDHTGLIKILRDQSGMFWTCLGSREPIKVIQTKSGLNGTKLRAIRELSGP